MSDRIPLSYEYKICLPDFLLKLFPFSARPRQSVQDKQDHEQDCCNKISGQYIALNVYLGEKVDSSDIVGINGVDSKWRK